jgi:hypothetical protein
MRVILNPYVQNSQLQFVKRMVHIFTIRLYRVKGKSRLIGSSFCLCECALINV